MALHFLFFSHFVDFLAHFSSCFFSQSARCLVRLLNFDRHSPSILPSGPHFRYGFYYVTSKYYVSVIIILLHHTVYPATLILLVFCSYSVLAKCADATATANIIFSGKAAALLFRMSPEEYVVLTEPAQQALLLALQGRMFIVEVQPVELPDIERARFVATNLWDPVAAFY
ncbi:hypothetical protein LINGRAHAP2_LOCUS6841 [Linum grandiflorum]